MNSQPIEKMVKRDVTLGLDVHSIFYTIQGEGPFTGRPAVFIRLAGCNLDCPACDTEYTKGRKHMTFDEISDEVIKAIEGKTRMPRSASCMGAMLIVITGGEPLRQQNLMGFLSQLDYRRFYVQIETNGTMPFDTDHTSFELGESFDDPHGVYLVVSPKGARVHKTLAERAHAWKYVASERSLYESADGLPTTALDNVHKLPRPPSWFPRQHIYLQPQDDKNEIRNRMNNRAVVESCMAHGYTLQIQTHKVIGVE